MQKDSQLPFGRGSIYVALPNRAREQAALWLYSRQINAANDRAA